MRSSVHSVRQHVAALRAALLAPSPEGLESQIPALELAIQELRSLTSPEDRQGLQALAQELRTAGKLVNHGLAFQQGWARLLAAGIGGYRPDGEPSPIPAAGSISVQG